MEWSPADPNRLLGVLDSMERVAVKSLRFLLGMLFVAILVGVVLVVMHPPWQGHQGEWFYFAVGVMLALGWTVKRYLALGRRQRDKLALSFRSKVENGGRTWGLQIGSPSEATSDDSTERPSGVQLHLSPTIEIPLASVAREALPDETTLARMEAELACGAELDDVCRAVQPDYADWRGPARWAYRQIVKDLLKQRRSGK